MYRRRMRIVLYIGRTSRKISLLFLNDPNVKSISSTFLLLIVCDNNMKFHSSLRYSLFVNFSWKKKTVKLNIIHQAIYWFWIQKMKIMVIQMIALFLHAENLIFYLYNFFIIYNFNHTWYFFSQVKFTKNFRFFQCFQSLLVRLVFMEPFLH